MQDDYLWNYEISSLDYNYSTPKNINVCFNGKILYIRLCTANGRDDSSITRSPLSSCNRKFMSDASQKYVLEENT